MLDPATPQPQLDPGCRNNATQEEREQLVNDLVREITSLWQTDELRRRRPSALDGVYC